MDLHSEVNDFRNENLQLICPIRNAEWVNWTIRMIPYVASGMWTQAVPRKDILIVYVALVYSVFSVSKIRQEGNTTDARGRLKEKQWEPI